LVYQEDTARLDELFQLAEKIRDEVAARLAS
jgi:hypothetical protein